MGWPLLCACDFTAWLGYSQKLCSITMLVGIVATWTPVSEAFAAIDFMWIFDGYVTEQEQGIRTRHK